MVKPFSFPLQSPESFVIDRLFNLLFVEEIEGKAYFVLFMHTIQQG